MKHTNNHEIIDVGDNEHSDVACLQCSYSACQECNYPLKEETVYLDNNYKERVFVCCFCGNLESEK